MNANNKPSAGLKTLQNSNVFTTSGGGLAEGQVTLDKAQNIVFFLKQDIDLLVSDVSDDTAAFRVKAKVLQLDAFCSQLNGVLRSNRRA